MKKLLLTGLILMAFIGIARAGTQTEKTLGERSYIFYEPASPASPCPLVLSYHPGASFSSSGSTTGWNGGSSSLDNTLNEEAERLGYCVAYPQGTYRTQFLQTWNARTDRCCGFASESKADDIEFARRIIADLAQNENIDTTKIYHTGYSNGSMMALSFCAAYPDLCDGYLGLAGPLMLDEDEAANFPAVPAVYMYGTSDDNVPPAGGLGSSENTIFPPTQDTIDFLSGNASSFTLYTLTGCEHPFASARECLSSEHGITYASAISAMVRSEQTVTGSNTSLDYSINGSTTSAFSTYYDGFLTDESVMRDGSYSGSDNCAAAANCNFGSTECDIRADFGEVINVTEINTACVPSTEPGGWGYTYTRDHDLEYSTDGSNWTVIDEEPLEGTWTNPCGVTNSQNVDIDARYIRIHKEAGDAPNFLAMCEFWFKANLPLP